MNWMNGNIISKSLLASLLIFTLSTIKVSYMGNNTDLALKNNSMAYAAVEYPSAIVVVNGKELILDQNAIVKNGSTLIPLRGVFSELGAVVLFNPKKQEVTIDHANATINLTIGSEIALVNNEEVTLPQPVEVFNGRTLIPLRFIGESIGAKVEWEQETSTAFITFSVTSDSIDNHEQQSNIITYDIETLYG